MELVLATHNKGKVAELAPLLAPLGYHLRPQSDFGVPEAAETGLTFVENALLKARHASQHTGLPALADDSGLCVDALNGMPGLHSARYAGPGAGSAANIAKLLEALAEVPVDQRSAHFHCSLVLLRFAEDPAPLITEGRWPGRILKAAQGSGGFGYDPVFYVPQYGCSAAELEPALKNRISHRGQAVKALLERLRAEG